MKKRIDILVNALFPFNIMVQEMQILILESLGLLLNAQNASGIKGMHCPCEFKEMHCLVRKW